MNQDQKKWRVRVYRKIEDWVEVQAESSDQAEFAAGNLPGVVHVFGMSATPANKPLASTDPLGVLGDEDAD